MKFPTALSLCFALSTPTLAQTVAVVAADGSGDFSSMQDAVDGVAPGSTLVVRGGTYLSPTIDKPVIVVADRGAFVQFLGTTDVVDLLADELVALRGIRVEASGADGPHAVDVTGPGTLWVEDCDLATTLVPPFAASHALNVVGGASVYLTRCELTAGTASFFSEVEGMSVEGSQVFVHESTITPGAGNTETWPAATVTDGFVFLSGSTLRGGHGADGFSFPPGSDLCATSGAPALVLAGTATAATIGSSLVGGDAGENDPCVPAAVAGEPFVAPPGAVSELPGTSRRFFATGEDSSGGSVTGGDELTLFFGGDLGDLAFLRISASAAPAYFAPFAGTVVSLTGTTRVLGLLTTPSFPTPASLAVTISTQPLDPSETIVSAYAQGVFANASGEVFLGPGSLVQVLPDGILTPSTL